MTAATAGRTPWRAVVAVAALLTAATPPAWWPGAEFLMLPGLALWFALATGARRPVLACYWLGALHVGAFSWSLRHVAWGGWLAVALLGGCYYAAVAVAARRAEAAGRAWRPVLAFAVAVAGAAWLRAEMPGIAYPHGQPCHAFWSWPALLGVVRGGGEPAANALLAALAAAGCQAVRGWRRGRPAWSRARVVVVAVAAVAVAITWWWAPPPPPAGTVTVAIAAVEPGVHPLDAYAGVAPDDRRALERRFRELFRAHWLVPTEATAGVGAAPAPDLVLWPESSVPFAARRDGDGSLSFDALAGAFELAPGVCLCLGAEIERDDRRSTPAALLLDATGRALAHQEKQRLVPAGETLPFVDWLPPTLAASVRTFLQTRVGVPMALPGARLPPLRLPARGARPELPFAALVCYDNAFPAVVAGAVADGARFVAVLSNEAWYRGGGELVQLAAISVLRAVATATPIVRCTTDGFSLAVDRDGRLLAALPVEPVAAVTGTRPPRILRIDLPVGDGRLPPMAAVHPWLGWGAAAALVAALLQQALAWARLLRLGPTRRVVGGSPPNASAGGS